MFLERSGIGVGPRNWRRADKPARLGCLQIVESMVARDGIEPPTPAFSGLGPAILILLILLLPLTFFAPETSFLLE